MKFRKITALALTLLIILAMLPAAALERHSGADRYATAAEISANGWTTADTVVLARGDNCVDAITGAPLAHYLQAPILLTAPGALSSAAKAEIQRLGAKKVVILGGTSAITPAVENSLKSMGLTVQRIGGKNRFDTAAQIAKQAAPGGADTVFLVNGDQPFDGLLAGPYAAALGAPILLTESSSLPEATQTALATLGAKHVNVIGDIGAVGQGVFNKLPSPQRFYGSDLYSLATSLAASFATGASHFYVASGNNCADALGAGALAAKNRTGILLVSSKVPQATRDFLVQEYVYNLTIIGGYAAVSKPVEDELTSLLKTQSYVSPRRPVTGVALDSTSLDMETGDTRQLLATISPANATNKKVTWETSDPAVATVSATGLVTAVGPGEAAVTVKTADGDITCSALATVTQPVTGVSLTPESLNLITGETAQLAATVIPDNASNKDVIWRSSDDSVATVDRFGIVTGTGPGEARITVGTVDGKYKARAVVTVTQPVTGVTLAPESLSLNTGETALLVATVIPDNASNKDVIWRSSEDNVATVDRNGLVTAVAPGDAVITVGTVDGRFNAYAAVNVTQPVTGIRVKSAGNVSEIYPGGTLQMTAVVQPDNASNPNVIWSIVRGDATIDECGLLSAGFTVGQFVVRAEAQDGGGARGQKTITIIPDQITGITDPADYTIIYGDPLNLPACVTAQLAGGRSEDVEVRWNEGIYDDALGSYTFTGTPVNLPSYIANASGCTTSLTITIIADQIIGVTPVEANFIFGTPIELPAQVAVQLQSGRTARVNVRWIMGGYDGGVGVYTIYGQLRNLPMGIANASNLRAMATVTIIQPVTGISLNPTSLSLIVGETGTLSALVSPDNASDKTVTWSSSDESVATVSDGVVTAVGPGTATITATTVDGDLSAWLEVTVSLPSAQLINLTVENSIVGVFWIGADLDFDPEDSNYHVDVPVWVGRVRLTPYAGPGAAILCNGTPINSGQAREFGRRHGYTDVTFTVQEPGKADQTYTVRLDW